MMTEFLRGDIVRYKKGAPNDPDRYMIYLGKGTYRAGMRNLEYYECLTRDGKKRQSFCVNDELRKVGHMAEFDSFMAALAELKDFREDA